MADNPPSINASQRVVNLRQGLLQVVEQVVDIFDADREAQESVGESARFANVFGDGAMRHGGGVADQRLNTAEAFGQGKDFEASHHGIDIGIGTFELEGDHAAEAAHLPFRQFMIGMVEKTGIVDLFNARMLGQEGGNGSCVFFVLAHTYGEGFDAAQSEPCIERGGDATGGILIELDGLVDLFVVQHKRTTDDIAMSINIFGSAVDNDVGTQFEGLLEVGTGEGVVHDEQNRWRAAAGLSA